MYINYLYNVYISLTAVDGSLQPSIEAIHASKEGSSYFEANRQTGRHKIGYKKWFDMDDYVVGFGHAFFGVILNLVGMWSCRVRRERQGIRVIAETRFEVILWRCEMCELRVRFSFMCPSCIMSAKLSQ